MNTVENKFGLQFLDFICVDESQIHQFHPLAGSFAVVTYDGKFLICFNRWRNQWELPAGKREPGETPKECAIRELYEETGQKVTDLAFKGLMKIKDTKKDEIKYNPVYFTELEELHPFIENNETTEIKLWLPFESLEPFDQVDFRLLAFFR